MCIRDRTKTGLAEAFADCNNNKNDAININMTDPSVFQVDPHVIATLGRNSGNHHAALRLIESQILQLNQSQQSQQISQPSVMHSWMELYTLYQKLQEP